MSEKDRALVARTVLQQCLHARLQVKPADEHSEAEFVQVKESDNLSGFWLKNVSLVSSFMLEFHI